MLSRGLRRLAQPIKRFASVELKEVAAEGGFNYDVILVAAWTGKNFEQKFYKFRASFVSTTPTGGWL